VYFRNVIPSCTSCRLLAYISIRTRKKKDVCVSVPPRTVNCNTNCKVIQDTSSEYLGTLRERSCLPEHVAANLPYPHTPLQFKLLKPTGYGMHQQVEYFNNCTLCPHCIYVFCVCLRTNSDLCHLHKQLVCFYNRDEKCLQRGTDWAFK
jgi:hypothetical protein